jgi:hypothetical protein
VEHEQPSSSVSITLLFLLVFLATISLIGLIGACNTLGSAVASL